MSKCPICRKTFDKPEIQPVMNQSAPAICIKCSTIVTSHNLDVNLIYKDANAYEELLADARKLREALLGLYDDTKSEHGIDEFEIINDTSSLGTAKYALSNFDSKYPEEKP